MALTMLVLAAETRRGGRDSGAESEESALKIENQAVGSSSSLTASLTPCKVFEPQANKAVILLFSKAPASAGVLVATFPPLFTDRSGWSEDFITHQPRQAEADKQSFYFPSKMSRKEVNVAHNHAEQKLKDEENG